MLDEQDEVGVSDGEGEVGKWNKKEKKERKKRAACVHHCRARLFYFVCLDSLRFHMLCTATQSNSLSLLVRIRKRFMEHLELVQWCKTSD